jgi:phosphatidylglycerophosphatase A
MTSNADSRFSAAPTSAATSATSARRPRFAIFVATACGLGYLPKAPGTWGSLGGLLLALVPWWAFNAFSVAVNVTKHGDELAFLRMAPWHMDPFVFCQIVLTVLAAAIGVWSADRTADFWGVKDPQRVVIDEVSGQHLTLLLGCAVPLWWRLPKDAWTSFPFGFETVNSALNWSVRHLEAVSRSASGIACGRLGNHGGRLDGGYLRRCRDMDRSSSGALTFIRLVAFATSAVSGWF